MAKQANSTWQSTVVIKPQYPALKREIIVDIAVIGAGIAGSSTAYFLRSLGRKVVLVEKSTVGKDAASALTTGFLSMPLDTDLTEMQKMFGSRKAKLYWRSQQEAIETVSKIIKKEKIDCEFRPVSEYFYATREDHFSDIEEEYKLAKKMGFNVKLHSSKKLKFPNFGSMEILKQAKFNSLKYIKALITIAAKNGVQVFEQSEVIEVMRNKGKVVISTSEGLIIADKAIICTHDPIYNPMRVYTKKGLYQTYILEAEIEKDSLEEATYDDVENPYHYFRVDGGEKFDRIILGGEDHRQDINVSPDKCFSSLEHYLKEIMGDRKYKIKRRWIGPIIEPVDGLPLIGSVHSDHSILVATAFSGTGLTFGMLSGMIFSDLIFNRKNPYALLYEPKRVPSLKQLYQKGKDYSGELVGGAIKNSFR